MKKLAALLLLMTVLLCGWAAAENRLDARIKEVHYDRYRQIILTEDGTLFGIGLDRDQDITYDRAPVFIDHDVEKVAVQFDSDVEILYLKRDGTVWSYGLVGNEEHKTYFVIDDAKDIYLYYNNEYIIRRDGSLWSHGFNNITGMLGNGTTKEPLAPVKVMDNVKKVFGEINYGAVHVLTEDNKLYGMGENSGYSYLGDGTRKNRTKPAFIMDDVKEVQYATSRTYALTHSGELYVWGAAGRHTDQGLVYWIYDGTGSNSSHSKPVKVMDHVRQFAINYASLVFAVTEDDKVWAWGGDTLVSGTYPGTGKQEAVKRPVVIMEPECGVREVGRSYAILNDDTLWVWGDTYTFGPDYLVPTLIAGNVLAYRDSKDYLLTSRPAHGNYFLDKDHRLWGWCQKRIVEGEEYQLQYDVMDEPFVVVENVERYLDDQFACAVTTDGKLRMWNYENLGNGMGQRMAGGEGVVTEINMEHYYPRWLKAELTGVPESDVAQIEQVVAGDHTYVLTEDGVLWGWGLNTGAQGNSSYEQVELPAAIMDGVEEICSTDPTWLLMKKGDIVRWREWSQWDDNKVEDLLPRVLAHGASSVVDVYGSLVYLDDQRSAWAVTYDGTLVHLLDRVASIDMMDTTTFYAVTDDMQLYEITLSRDNKVTLTCLGESGWAQVVGQDNDIYALDVKGELYTRGYINSKRGAEPDAFVHLLSGVKKIIGFGNPLGVMAEMEDGSLWKLNDQYMLDMDGQRQYDWKPNPRPILDETGEYLENDQHLYILTEKGELLRHAWEQSTDACTEVAEVILSDVRSASITDEACMALTGDGGVWLWGRSIYSQEFAAYVDEEGTIDLPTRITEYPGAVEVYATGADDLYYALTDDGTLMVAGDWSRKMGTLEIPADIFTFVPVQIYQGKQAKAVFDGTAPQPSAPPAEEPDDVTAEAPEQKPAEDAATYQTLKKGSKGSDVLAMKERLQELGYFKKGAEMSNVYNDTCAERVKQFQKANGLRQTGVADPDTLALLFSEQAKPKK